MAWENLETEIVELFGDARPDLMPINTLYVAVERPRQFAGGRANTAPLSIRERGVGEKDLNELRWKRRMLAEARTRYTEADRNRTYTVRRAIRTYQRGAVCDRDTTGRFVKLTA